VFLVAFFYLQSRTGPLAKIPETFLWFSLVPLILFLFLGGYISGVKFGGIEVDERTDKLGEELTVVQGQSLTVAAPSTPAVAEPAPPKRAGAPAGPSAAAEAGGGDMRKEYTDEYDRTGHYMLAHICRPSKWPEQFDIFIFAVRHERGSPGPPKLKLDDVKYAEFYLGPSWRDEPFLAENKGGPIGIRTRAWGTFLASCKLTFKNDRPPVTLYRFIDFYMDPTYRQEFLPS
jgi:hypothetical protein